MLTEYLQIIKNTGQRRPNNCFHYKAVEALKVLKPDIQQFTIEDVIPEDHLNKEAKNDIEKIKEIEKIQNRDLIFEININK